MSRRFKNRHEKADADPTAKAPADLSHQAPDLDDSNSFVPPEQPDMRVANELNRRAYIVAGHDELPEADE